MIPFFLKKNSLWTQLQPFAFQTGQSGMPKHPSLSKFKINKEVDLKLGTPKSQLGLIEKSVKFQLLPFRDTHGTPTTNFVLADTSNFILRLPFL